MLQLPAQHYTISVNAKLHGGQLGSHGTYYSTTYFRLGFFLALKMDVEGAQIETGNIEQWAESMVHTNFHYDLFGSNHT